MKNMEFKAKYSKLFPRFAFHYKELYGKQLAAIMIYLFHFGFGVKWKKKVSAKSKYVIDSME